MLAEVDGNHGGRKARRWIIILTMHLCSLSQHELLSQSTIDNIRPSSKVWTTNFGDFSSMGKNASSIAKACRDRTIPRDSKSNLTKIIANITSRPPPSRIPLSTHFTTKHWYPHFEDYTFEMTVLALRKVTASQVCPGPPPFSLKCVKSTSLTPYLFQNGVGAFILQCKKLDFHYCDWAGSSKGMKYVASIPHTCIPRFNALPSSPRSKPPN